MNLKDKMITHPSDETIMQELTTYHKVNGVVTKTVVTRKFYSDGFEDTQTTIPMVRI